MQRPPLFGALEHPKHLAIVTTHLRLTAARLMLQCLAQQAVQFADNLNMPRSLQSLSLSLSLHKTTIIEGTISALSIAKKLLHTSQPLLVLPPSTSAPAL